MRANPSNIDPADKFLLIEFDKKIRIVFWKAVQQSVQACEYKKRRPYPSKKVARPYRSFNL